MTVSEGGRKGGRAGWDAHVRVCEGVERHEGGLLSGIKKIKPKAVTHAFLLPSLPPSLFTLGMRALGQGEEKEGRGLTREQLLLRRAVARQERVQGGGGGGWGGKKRGRLVVNVDEDEEEEERGWGGGGGGGGNNKRNRKKN